MYHLMYNSCHTNLYPWQQSQHYVAVMQRTLGVLPITLVISDHVCEIRNIYIYIFWLT